MAKAKSQLSNEGRWAVEGKRGKKEKTKKNTGKSRMRKNADEEYEIDKSKSLGAAGADFDVPKEENKLGKVLDAIGESIEKGKIVDGKLEDASSVEVDGGKEGMGMKEVFELAERKVLAEIRIAIDQAIADSGENDKWPESGREILADNYLQEVKQYGGEYGVNLLKNLCEKITIDGIEVDLAEADKENIQRIVNKKFSEYKNSNIEKAAANGDVALEGNRLVLEKAISGIEEMTVEQFEKAYGVIGEHTNKKGEVGKSDYAFDYRDLFEYCIKYLEQEHDDKSSNEEEDYYNQVFTSAENVNDEKNLDKLVVVEGETYIVPKNQENDLENIFEMSAEQENFLMDYIKGIREDLENDEGLREKYPFEFPRKQVIIGLMRAEAFMLIREYYANKAQEIALGEQTVSIDAFAEKGTKRILKKIIAEKNVGAK
mgnify:CR=1 FL=1